MNISLITTVAGPLLAWTGFLGHSSWIFWTGVAICAITLHLNMSVGAMKLPVLPVAFMVIIAIWYTPWYFGLGLGLIAWTTLDAFGEIIGHLRGHK